MTKELRNRCIKWHRRMWDWIIKNEDKTINLDKNKINFVHLFSDALRADSFDVNLLVRECCACFGCYYARMINGADDTYYCQYCPFDWGGEDCIDIDDNTKGLFSQAYEKRTEESLRAVAEVAVKEQFVSDDFRQ